MDYSKTLRDIPEFNNWHRIDPVDKGWSADKKFYIEANEALGKKDFAMRIRICRKEAKESRYWLMFTETVKEEMSKTQESLIDEADQLMKIFATILLKTTK